MSEDSVPAKKIVRVIARLNVGGPARHVTWLTDAMSYGEYRSTLVAGRVPEGEDDMSYLAEAHGVKPVFIEQMSRELSPMDLVSLFKIYALLLRERPDILHTHTAKAGTVGRTAGFLYRWLTPGTLIGRPRRLAVVHTFHGHVFHSYYGRLKTALFVAIEKTLARFATNRIVVISKQQFEEIHEQVGIGRAEQFAIVPLGIDLEPFAAAGANRDEAAARAGTVRVGILGRLTEIKNIPLFLEAAQAYEKAADGDVPAAEFFVVGDGHLRRSLETEAGERGIGNLKFLGARKDVEAVYAGLDIVALTSLNEGTPLSLIEAMAGRKPVISTTVGGVVDLLGAVTSDMGAFRVHERGIGVSSGDAAGFAKGLIYLAKNERLREELSARGHAFVHENYAKERLIEDIKRLYRGLSGADAPSRRRIAGQ